MGKYPLKNSYFSEEKAILPLDDGRIFFADIQDFKYFNLMA